MSVLQTLVRRARQFGLRRSVAVYLFIVVGLVLASEIAIEHIIGQEGADPGMPVLNALAIAALVGVFVFFLFQGAVEDRERAGVALANSEERFRSLTALSADWFWETDAEHRLSWIAGGQSMLELFGSGLAYGQRLWEVAGMAVAAPALEMHLAALAARKEFHDFELCRPGGDSGSEYHLISGEPRTDSSGQFCGYRGVGRNVTERKNAEKALSGAMGRLETALDSGALAIWDSHVPTGRIFLSEGWAQMLGDPDGVQHRKFAEVVARMHAQDRDGAMLASRRAVKGEAKSFSAEIRMQTASGGWKWVVTSGRVVERDEAGRALRVAGTVVDIDRRKRAEYAMRDAEARYRTLVDLSPDAVLLQSDGRIEYANRAAADMLGVAGPVALVGRETMTMVHADDHAMVLDRDRYLRAGPGKSEFRERRMLRKDGSVVTVEGASVSYLERGRLVVQTVLRDISERVRTREELAEREQRFRDVVEAAGEYVWETDAQFRYTWLSDRIEAVLGYVRVDLIGRRPQEFMPLGEARAIEERLLGHSRRGEAFRDLVHRSITKSGRVIWQSMTGVPVFEAGGALKGFRGTGTDITAKRQAEERIQFLATRDALTGLPNRLHRAIARGEFVLRFQPIVRGGAGPKSGGPAPTVVGAEVLLYWQHPVKGLLAPEQFIPLAEKSGLMGALGTWLIERACERIAGWREGPLTGLWFALNVPIKEFSRDRNFAGTLEQSLRDNRLEGARLSLELAERSMQPGGNEHLATLKAIADLGIALTIDELGTGQFDLALLRQMPVAKLKIDRRFIADIATREDAAIIVQTLAAMAKGLGLAFCAEGVENAAQLARLRALGCEEWQGRLYSEPLDAAAFEHLLSVAPRAAASA